VAKAVYRPEELELLDQKVVLDPPTAFPELQHLTPVEEEVEEIPEAIAEYEGPTADDLRREAEEFRAQWEIEKENLIAAVTAEAGAIKKEAEEAARKELKQKTAEAQTLTQKAGEEAGRIIAEANDKAKQIEAEAKAASEARLKEAEEEGRRTGHEAGYEEGTAEVERLIARTKVMLERAQEKRGEILAESEQEIIDLVLLIARKIIKVITENQKTVIVSNVVEALRKVKDKGNVTIRVNMSDVQLTTEHIKEFIQLVEGSKSIQVAEDSSVDQGGCIIETDFGEIDARIASQLAELESKILEISPITSKPKPPSVPEGEEGA
jgi:flagellar assembly protein FliH